MLLFKTTNFILFKTLISLRSNLNKKKTILFNHNNISLQNRNVSYNIISSNKKYKFNNNVKNSLESLIFIQLRQLTTSGGEKIPFTTSNFNNNQIKDSINSNSTTSHNNNNSTIIEGSKSSTTFYSQEFNKFYGEMERNMMKRINESNQRRFRIVLISSVLFIVWIVAIFGKKIRQSFTKEAAGLARETLENESLKIQTQELAMAVVQTILDDKEVTTAAGLFLQEAAAVPETQQALVNLTTHVLKHPETLKEVNILCNKLMEILANEPETKKILLDLLVFALQDPKMYEAFSKLCLNLSEDPEIVKVLSKLFITVISQPEVVSSIKSLMMTTSHTVLQDEGTVNLSKEFVADVMSDATLQREGGDALISSVTQALKPGMIRIAGVGLVCFSIAFAKVLLSPF